MTAMLAPRPALLICNENDDCCFRTDRTKPIIYDDVRPTYEAMGAADKFEFYSNQVPGTHNYDADNRSRLYRFLNKHWDLASSDQDLHREDDIRGETVLNVGLPANQTTMMDLALRQTRKLIAGLRTPKTAAARSRLRKDLTKVLRLPRYDLVGANDPFPGGISTRSHAGRPVADPDTARTSTRPAATTNCSSSMSAAKTPRTPRRPAAGTTASSPTSPAPARTSATSADCS